MTIEDRVRDALHDYADPIEPAPGSWEQISSRFDEPRRRAPGPSRFTVAFAVVALALVVVLVTTLVVNDDGDGARVVTTGTAPMPGRILAVTTDGRPVILDAASGEQTFRYDWTDRAPAAEVAVSPDGREAWVGERGDGGCQTSRLVHLPIAEGLEFMDTVPRATNPTFSPDGRHLAYLQCPLDGVRPDAILLRDLRTGEERDLRSPAGTTFASRLEFAADSRHVYFALADDLELRELDLVGGEAPPGRAVGIGFLTWPRGERADEYILLKGPTTVMGAKGPSPFTAGKLFGLPDVSKQLVSDASGSHVLALVAGDSLYRWSEGDDEPTKVADGIVAATWIPDAPGEPPSEPERPVEPSSRPQGIVAMRTDEYVTLDAESGRMQGRVRGGGMTGRRQIAASPDGRTIVMTGGRELVECRPSPEPKLLVVYGDPKVVVSGAVSAAINVDNLVAYGYFCDGRGLGMTDLDTGENYRTDALGGRESETDPRIEAVEPLGWSPGGSRLLYRVSLEDDARPHLYVGRLWPAVRQRETEVFEIPGAAAISAAALIDEEHLAFAVPEGGRTEVHRMELSLAENLARGLDRWDATSLLVTGDGDFAVDGRVTSLVADPSGRHLLAVTDSGDLYRWSRGDTEPTKLAEGVTSAAWLPWS